MTVSPTPAAEELAAKRARALRHALAEYELRSYVVTAGPAARRDPGPMKRRIPLAPAEGWLTLGLVLLICFTMAWAIDDARWVLGRPKYLDYLVVRRRRWGPGRVHRPEGRLGPLADLSHRLHLRRADRAAR